MGRAPPVRACTPCTWPHMPLAGTPYACLCASEHIPTAPSRHPAWQCASPLCVCVRATGVANGPISACPFSLNNRLVLHRAGRQRGLRSKGCTLVYRWSQKAHLSVWSPVRRPVAVKVHQVCGQPGGPHEAYKGCHRQRHCQLHGYHMRLHPQINSVFFNALQARVPPRVHRTPFQVIQGPIATHTRVAACSWNLVHPANSIMGHIFAPIAGHSLAHQGHVVLMCLQLVQNMLQLPAPVHLHALLLCSTAAPCVMHPAP